jgi:hypothetical protein
MNYRFAITVAVDTRATSGTVAIKKYVDAAPDKYTV